MANDISLPNKFHSTRSRGFPVENANANSRTDVAILSKYLCARVLNLEVSGPVAFRRSRCGLLLRRHRLSTLTACDVCSKQNNNPNLFSKLSVASTTPRILFLTENPEKSSPWGLEISARFAVTFVSNPPFPRMVQLRTDLGLSSDSVPDSRNWNHVFPIDPDDQ